MTEEWRSLFDLILNEVLLFTIAYTLLLKALNIRRMSRLGEAIASNNFAFVLAYVAAGLALWIDPFTSDPWRYFIRFAILVTAVRVLIELKRAYGGWKALHGRAWESFRDMLRRR